MEMYECAERRGNMMEIGKRLPGLDGLRAIFCVGIVLFHVNGAFGSVFSGWAPSTPTVVISETTCSFS